MGKAGQGPNILGRGDGAAADLDRKLVCHPETRVPWSAESWDRELRKWRVSRKLHFMSPVDTCGFFFRV